MAISEQQWNPARYAKQARFVAELGDGVLALLAPQPGERVLDLGCGDGALTRKLVELGCDAVGVDASPEMIAAARNLGLDAHVIDGHALAFEDAFDAVFSNAALHWMTRPEAVLAGVRKALRPGGRFVGEFGGEGNVAVIVGALEAALRERGVAPAPLNPWYFPSAEAYRSLLENHGFAVTVAETFPRPTLLPNDVVGWLETFAQSYIGALPEAARKDFLETVADRCRPLLCDEDGRWTADYVRLRFAATKA